MRSASQTAAALALVAAGACSAAAAAAAPLYSVDILNKTLVKLDAETGAVTIVGFAGFPNLVTFDLAYVDGRIFALSQHGAVHELHTLDPATGAREATVPVELDGAPIGRATGLAAYEGHLLIGFTPDTEGERATHLGRLHRDGTITDVVDFTAFDADFHGLTVAPDGATLYSIDSGFSNDLYRTTIAPQTHAMIGGGDFSAVNDLVVRGTQLWGLSGVAQDVSTLFRIDTATGDVLEEVQIDVLPGQSLFTGLARVTCASDFDGDGATTFGDLLALLATWGPCGGCPQDLDGSGAVDVPDLILLLAAWGDCE